MCLLFKEFHVRFLDNVLEKGGKREPQDLYSFKTKIRASFKYITSKIMRRQYFTVWFNCWRYEKEDELWAAFALNFIEQLSGQLSWGWRQFAKIKLIFLRLQFKWKSNSSILFHILLCIIYIVVIALFWVAILYYRQELMGWLFSYSKDEDSVKRITNILLIFTALLGLMRHFLSVGKDFIKFLGNPFDFSNFVQNSNYVEHISFIENFHSDFNKIIKSYAGNSRVYVFIDDLDRCETQKAAELMQALNLMISDKSNVYFSIGMDREVISAGLASKHKNILRYLSKDGLSYGYDFIEKFIQLPFKVPSPKTEDFREFLKPLKKKKNNFLSKILKKIKACLFTLKSDKESVQQLEIKDGFEPDKQIPSESAKKKSVEVKKVLNDYDCNERSKEIETIIRMAAPALDSNPRRIKQFINLFRFQRTIGYKTGLFSYDENSAHENMWNCKKLAKFVVISINWPSLISSLRSNRTLFDQLQEYALKPKDKNECLEELIRDEKLIDLLRYGCVRDDHVLQNEAEYSISGLDFSKLLQISPVVTSPKIYAPGISTVIDEIEFVLIHAGEFTMGSKIHDYEQPAHKVIIEKSFYLSKNLITQKQWERVMGSNPSRFKGDDRPIENVSWDEVQDFIKILNSTEGTNRYRLPSEAEWEYACRAGTTTRFYFGDEELELEDYAWYGNYSGPETHPVGQKKPNQWGLYDMHGNVWEWVHDKWHDNYKGAPSNGNAWGDGKGSFCVTRGGGWGSFADDCRSAYRRGYFYGNRSITLGFRLLRKL